ncbi:MAG: type IV pilin protein [Bdellovibrionales bacterium]
MARNPKGMTMVEALVIAGIMGILAAIAVPLYRDTIIRSRVNEAKSMLSKIYSAEKMFQAEHLSFTACIRQIGVQPYDTLTDSTAGKRWYFVGFRGPVAGNNCGPGASQSCFKFSFASPDPMADRCSCLPGVYTHPAGNDCTYEHTEDATGGAGPPVSVGPPWVVPNSANFVAGADGRISSGVPGNPKDSWTIDHDKNLQHVNTGY